MSSFHTVALQENNYPALSGKVVTFELTMYFLLCSSVSAWPHGSISPPVLVDNDRKYARANYSSETNWPFRLLIRLLESRVNPYCLGINPLFRRILWPNCSSADRLSPSLETNQFKMNLAT